jgi:hypothetical protein
MTLKPASSDTTVPGLLAMATGIGVAFMVNIGSQPGDAPAWVGDVCAAAFFCAGLALVAQARGWTLLNRLAGLCAVFALLVPGFWVVVGGDPSRCSVGLALGSLSLEGADGLLCRSVFGFGALLTVAIALVFAWQAFAEARRWLASRRLPATKTGRSTRTGA